MMSSRTPPSTVKKRPNENPTLERARKSLFGAVKAENDSAGDMKTFRFRVLLPNGMTLELKMHEMRKEMSIEEFIEAVKNEYYTVVKERSSTEPRGKINWKYPDMHFTDAHGKKISLKVNLQNVDPNNWQIFRLHDGTPEPEVYEDMWDLTPDTDLLKELPDEYTYETALADLIDNSLQALWSNSRGEKRLISVKLSKNKISIFDSGPGMDGSEGKIVKWGKMGSSLNRTSRPQAVGGKPPYLTPYFGMFGYGGPVATMHLGKRAVVASKTKSCNIVFTLYLERDALVNSSCPENRWKTKGGMRDPLPDEKEKFPHGSFTKVEIMDLKMKSPDAKLLQCKLKDIYFPYIQCDEVHGKTSRPIEFRVNGIDLAEIEGGEVATTNLHSCNGPTFVLQLKLSFIQDASPGATQREKTSLEANARLKCVYFPVIEGEESFNNIIKKLEEDGYGIRESYECFSRVSIRRLGRLLPDSRWPWLPFMEPKQRKGEKAQLLRRCCFRVKCFVDADSGFNPTPAKTDLAHQHPYTLALKNFGNSTPVNEEVKIEVYRNGKKLNLSQVEKQYHDWLLQMHERYDEEIDAGVDESTLVFVPHKDKKLGISSDVARVHKEIRRKGKFWKAGQKIKLLKGACSGCHKNNIFATIECFLLTGLQGDTCGEARIICRPIEVPEGKGCSISAEKIALCRSLSFPVSVLDSGKCLEIDDTEWNNKFEQNDLKLPSHIELLTSEECQQLEIEGGEFDDVVQAGDAPPDQIVAVVRPKNFSGSSNRLDQKFIVRGKFSMTLKVSSRAGHKNAKESEHYSVSIEPAIHKGLNGLYIFPLTSKMPLFQKTGFYTFSFSLVDPKNVHLDKVVQVKATAESCRWSVRSDDPNERPIVMVGSVFPPLYISCSDQYENNVPLASIPELTVKFISNGTVLAQVSNPKVSLTDEKSTMKIEGIMVNSCKLDKIRPNYDASLIISTPDGEFSVEHPCRVIPGIPQKITVHPKSLKKQLVPGQIIEELGLEVFDSYGNHAKKDAIVTLRVVGFSFHDGTSNICKVDDKGYVELSNILKVSEGYGKNVFLYVAFGEKFILKLKFQTETRELRTPTKVFEHCDAGSQLENLVFEVTDSNGVVDRSINDDDKHGKPHTLSIKSESFDVDDSVRYSFRHGRCCIRSIPLPATEGTFTFTATHSHYRELNIEIEVHVEKLSRENSDNIMSPENIEDSWRDDGNISPENIEKFRNDNGDDIGSPESNENELSPQVPCGSVSEPTPQSLFKVGEPRRETWSPENIKNICSTQVPYGSVSEPTPQSLFKVREPRHETWSPENIESVSSPQVPYGSVSEPTPQSLFKVREPRHEIRSPENIENEHSHQVPYGSVSEPTQLSLFKVREPRHETLIPENIENEHSHQVPYGSVSEPTPQSLFKVREPRHETRIPENIENELSPQVPCTSVSDLTLPPLFRFQESGHETEQRLERAIIPFGCTTSLKSPKAENSNSRDEISDRMIVPIDVDSKNRGNFSGHSTYCLKALTDNLAIMGLKVGEREKTLENLERRHLRIQQDLSDLRDALKRESHMSIKSEKEILLKQIETKGGSAAAVICKAIQELPDSVIGIVGLLGSFESIELSRMLTQYLGEDYVLAIVCKDYDTANSLETLVLPKLADKYGLSIRGQYQVLCLDNISPFLHKPSRNPGDPLPLLVPTLQNGEKPLGFLGHAVNMITIESSHMNYRTTAGYGLRETLFYRLFGELQVYQNKECMELARFYIKDGAISLDGGIVRGNGLVSFGDWEPDICFLARVPKAMSLRNVDTYRQVQAKEADLVDVRWKISQENELYEKDKEQLQVLLERYKSTQRGDMG